MAARLDDELWLTAEERDAIFRKVLQEMPSLDYKSSYRDYIHEVELLCVPLFRFSKHDLADLTDQQKAAWESLAGQFTFDGRTVSFTTPHGGQFQFSLPQ
ncbi:MAG: hypothetical protein R3C49_20655 [Planctomycetaceae bacterium]